MTTSKATDKPCPKCKAPLFLTMAGFHPAVICKACGFGALTIMGDLAEHMVNRLNEENPILKELKKLTEG